jgi:hypothetical protein
MVLFDVAWGRKMPGIHGWKSTSGSPSHVSWKRRDYGSPDKQWNVAYHSPREWHMGADGWQVRLFHKQREVTAEHKAFLRTARVKGFRCEPDLQPWSYDSKILGFMSWNEHPVHIYEVATKRAVSINCGTEFVYSVQWAPVLDRLLIISATGAALMDREGTQHGAVAWKTAENGRLWGYWAKAGQWLFLLGRESSSAGTMLTFYRGEDAQFGEAHQLDPRDLIPYDAREYEAVPRGRFSLIINSGTRAVGSLLDTWHGVEFDRASDTLYLAVYRPVSAVYYEGAECLCKVEERWIAVQLAT